MKKQTQAETNPFSYSDSNRRFHTYDYFLRHRYGGKCVKIALDANMTCPNIDGTRGVGGCIYCSSSGSGNGLGGRMSISEQYAEGRRRLSSKWDTSRCIPYLQAHTNTYAPIDRLRGIFDELLSLPDKVGINIATRTDCIDRQNVELLADISRQTDLTIELGLQSVFDHTAAIINRCHTYDEFLRGFDLIRERCPRALICVHLINGLPGENLDMMIESARQVSDLGVDQMKLHLLHVLRGTRLHEMYVAGDYTPMTLEEYVESVVRQLEVIRPETVICRITGDGEPYLLEAPMWSRKKFAVADEIDKMMYQKDTWQGKNARKC